MEIATHLNRQWKLQFYIYWHRKGLSHRLRLRLLSATSEERTIIHYFETHTDTLPRRYVVYQKLPLFPLYLHRPDIHGVLLDGEFFYGLPTSTCLLSLGSSFVLMENKLFLHLGK